MQSFPQYPRKYVLSKYFLGSPFDNQTSIKIDPLVAMYLIWWKRPLISDSVFLGFGILMLESSSRAMTRELKNYVRHLRRSVASASMAWVRTRLRARSFLDASSQRVGFTCLRTRLSSALKFSSREYYVRLTHWHWPYWIQRPGAKKSLQSSAP